MSMFISLYGIMNGIFVSNFADKTSFAAIGFILLFLSTTNAFDYMLGTRSASRSRKSQNRKFQHRKRRFNAPFESVLMARTTNINTNRVLVATLYF